MYVRMSASGAPIGDAEVEAEQVWMPYDEAESLKVLDYLIDEAANKLRRMYGIEAK